MNFLKNLNFYSEPAPLFIWAFWLLLGSGVALYPPLAIHALILLILACWKQDLKVGLVSLFLILVGLGYTCISIASLPSGKKPKEGFAHFQIQSVAPFSSFFQKSYALKGHLISFHEKEGPLYHHIPCTLFMQNPLSPDADWLMKGTLTPKGSYRFAFKQDKKIPATAIKHPLSLKKWRFENKEKIRSRFRKKSYPERVSSFFSSTITGDPDNKLLSMEFYKVGLGHILAISGFHFALLAGVLRFLLKIIIPSFSDLLLLTLLSLYIVFLGFSPSALRAFIMIALFLCGSLLRRRSSTLNLLGAASLIQWGLDPLILTTLGFQLTFLATFGLIFFYRPVLKILELFSPLRPLDLIKKMTLQDKVGYLVLSFVKSALAIDISITLTTLPLTLFVFKGYFLAAPFYNLVIPPLLSISIALIPFGLLLPPLEWINAHYTEYVLKFLANPPQLLHQIIWVPPMPLPLLFTLLLIPLCLALYQQKRKHPYSETIA